jgi:hypothetical protein
VVPGPGAQASRRACQVQPAGRADGEAAAGELAGGIRRLGPGRGHGWVAARLGLVEQARQAIDH